MNKTTMRELLTAGFYAHIDVLLAEQCVSEETDTANLQRLAVLTVSRLARLKHACADLEQLPPEATEDEETGITVQLPEISVWLKSLQQSVFTGGPGEYKPLILDGKRLYLQKYHDFECSLTSCIARLNQQQFEHPAPHPGSMLHELFSGSEDNPDWQRVATANALLRPFSVITGGPGTGKTTTVARILLLLTSAALNAGQSCRIALCAPTGKAAAHMLQSLAGAMTLLEKQAAGNESLRVLLDTCRPHLPQHSHTLHRLLGSIPGRARFAHNAENPLPWDIIVIDEMSMADIALAARFFEAVRPGTRVICLGDRDQLSSVEAGSVMGDLCLGLPSSAWTTEQADAVRAISGDDILREYTPCEVPAPMTGAVVALSRSRRFSAESGIGRCAAMIRDGKADQVINGFESSSFEGVTFFDPRQRTAEEYVPHVLRAAGLAGRDCHYNKIPAVEATDREMFDWLGDAQILCALRHGPWGADALNNIMSPARGNNLQHGQPVIITRNDHARRLYNGDAGIARVDAQGVKLVFNDRSTPGTFRHFNALQLQDYEAAWALTVHKSQGSEYRNVVIILGDRVSRVMTRELLYTALTRAREKAVLIASPEVIRSTCLAETKRGSGLGDRLWAQS